MVRNVHISIQVIWSYITIICGLFTTILFLRAQHPSLARHDPITSILYMTSAKFGPTYWEKIKRKWVAWFEFITNIIQIWLDNCLCFRRITYNFAIKIITRVKFELHSVKAIPTCSEQLSHEYYNIASQYCHITRTRTSLEHPFPL